jgi:hypothetical protein
MPLVVPKPPQQHQQQQQQQQQQHNGVPFRPLPLAPAPSIHPNRQAGVPKPIFVCRPPPPSQISKKMK